MNNFVYLILTKCSRLQALRSFAQILLKSCFHRFYLNLIFKNRVCWFELLLGKKHLPKLSFFTDSYCAGGVSNKHCLLTFFIFDFIFIILAGNKDNHKSLDEFELKVEPTLDCGANFP